MAAVERIDSLYDIASIEGESSKLQQILQRDATAIVELYSNIEKFQGKSNVSTVSKNWADVTNAMVGSASASEALIGIQKQLNEQMAKTAQLEKQLADATDKGTTVNKRRKDQTDAEILANYEASKSVKERVKDVIAQTDAYKQLVLQYDRAAASAKTLGAKAVASGTPEDKDAAAKASAQAKALHDNLVGVETAVGQAQRKVGSYTDALKPLEEELKIVNKQLADLELKAKAAGGGVQNLTGKGSAPINPVGFDVNKNKPGGAPTNFLSGTDAAQYKSLTTQAEALNIVIGKQAKGFTSVTQEIRTSERALQTLRAAGLEGSEGFERLRASTATAAREQHKFSQEQKVLEDNLPILKSLTIAAKGLAGMYAIGAGTTALFAEGNEHVEKELNKLVAIMTVLQGLQETYELLEKSSAIATVFKTDVVEAAFASSIKKAQAEVDDAAATLAAADANVEATAGTEAYTEALLAQTAAAEGVAVAEAELVSVTATANSALAATAIGAVILVVAAAVVYLVIQLREMGKATELTFTQQKELNEVLAQQIEYLQKINDLYDTAGKKAVADLQHQLELEEKSGQNQYAIFAIKEKIAAKNAEIADSKYALSIAHAEDMYVKDGLMGIDALRRAQGDYFEKVTEDTYKLDVLQKHLSDLKAIPDKDRTRENKRDIETNLPEIIDAAKSQQKVDQTSYEYYVKAEEDKTKTHDEEENLRTEKAKFAEDERRKYVLESTKLEADGIKEANDRILSDARSNLSQRLGAVYSSALQDRVKAGADFNDVANNTSTTPTQLKAARERLNAENAKIDKDYYTKQRDIKYDFYVLDRDAQVDIFNQEQQDRINHNEAILADEKSTSKQRMDAEADSYDATRAMRQAQFFKDMDQLGLTDTQKLAISKQYETDLTKMQIDNAKIREDEQKKAREKEIEQIEHIQKRANDATTIAQSDRDTTLDKGLLSGSISPGTFDQKKSDSAFKAQQEEAQAAVAAANARVQETGAGTREEFDARAQLAKATQDLDDLTAQHAEANIKKRNDLEKQAAEDTAKAIGSLIDAGFERQVKNIEKQIELNNKLKDTETRRINDSTLGEQQRANAIRIINANNEQQNLALERRERQIKIQQAKFDRDQAVAETIEQGAIAAIAALKIPVYGEAEAIAIGIITAAKVTEILARPLPTYGFGTEDHIGGLAILGDRFRQEGIAEPGKPFRLSPAVPTVMNLAAHTKVIPHEELERMQEAGMFIDAAGRLVSKAEGNGAREITQAMVWQTDRLEKALAKQKKTVVVNTKINLQHAEYIQKSVYK